MPVINQINGKSASTMNTVGPNWTTASTSKSNATPILTPPFLPIIPNIAWVPCRLQPLDPRFGSAPNALPIHTNIPQAPFGAPYPPNPAGDWEASIDPSLQQMQDEPILTAKAPVETAPTPPVSPLKKRKSGAPAGNAARPPVTPSKKRKLSPEPVQRKSSSKHLRSSARLQNQTQEHDITDVPSLCEQTSKNVWSCIFRHPDLKGTCRLVCTGTRDLYRHIGAHAKEEELLITKGRLLLKDAVAIPHQLLEFQCGDQDCKYFKEKRMPYKYMGNSFDDVDDEKAKHFEECH